MIVETAIISVAAIIVASLMTANAIHKRAVAAEDVDGETRRLLERMRQRAVNGKASCNGKREDWAAEWEKDIRDLDEKLLKLARGEFQVPRTDNEATAQTRDAKFGGVKGTNPWPEGQHGP